MLTADELDDLRDDLETFELPDTVDVWRATGNVTHDPVTHEPIPEWEQVYASIKALVVREPMNQQIRIQGDAPQSVRSYSVTLPVSADVRVEDVLVVIGSHDVATTGGAMTVKDPQFGSLSISRRVRCQWNETFPRGVPEGTS